MEKGQVGEIVVVAVATLIGIVLFTPVQGYCYRILNPILANGSLASDSGLGNNVSALSTVFLTLLPFAYILLVFAVAIGAVIAILK